MRKKSPLLIGFEDHHCIKDVVLEFYGTSFYKNTLKYLLGTYLAAEIKRKGWECAGRESILHLPPLHRWWGGGGVDTRKCNDRRGSSGERDSWKGGGEGMEGKGGVKMLK